MQWVQFYSWLAGFFLEKKTEKTYAIATFCTICKAKNRETQ